MKNMNCFFCQTQAEYLCECFAKMCEKHLAAHSRSCKKFKVKLIEECDLIKILSIELNQRIIRINQTIFDTIQKTSEFLKKVKFLCAKNINTLKTLSEKYQTVLYSRNLDSLKLELKSEIIERPVFLPETKLIETYYNQKFYYEKTSKISFKNAGHAKKILEQEYGLVIEDSESAVWSVAITDNNEYVVSGGLDDTVKIWNLKERRQEAALRGHTGTVWSLAISYDNKYIISGSSDCSIRIWNFEQRSLVGVLIGHTDTVWSIAITGDNKYIVSGGGDNTVRVWNVMEKNQEAVLHGHSSYIKCVKVTDDNKYVVSVSKDNAVRIWNLEKKHPETVLHFGDWENEWVKKYPEICSIFELNV